MLCAESAVIASNNTLKFFFSIELSFFKCCTCPFQPIYGECSTLFPPLMLDMELLDVF